MPTYYITDTNWNNFIQLLSKLYNTFGLVANGDNLFWQRVTPDYATTFTVNSCRGVTPLKSFFFPAREEVTRTPERQRKNILIGVKACDLGQLAVMDRMFLEGPVKDPYYELRRNNTIIIASDCDAVLPSCFCTMMGGVPYPVKGFDLGMTKVRAGYLIDTGSPAGEELLGSRKSVFQDPQENYFHERDLQREKVLAAVKENNRSFTWTSPKDAMRKGFASKKWEEEIAASCVECDACRFSCGSCYCFLLSEGKNQWERVRTWDSCQSAGYARVAGGANPRKNRADRLRNLYTCKMIHRHDNFGVYGCTGCGRCIEVCQGKIDIRKSLQKLHDEK